MVHDHEPAGDPVVVQAKDSPVPVIDTTIAHAQAAVEIALAGEPAQPAI